MSLIGLRKKKLIEEEIEEDFYSDIDIEKEMEIKERNLKLFEKIVGDNPFKQIDWIIENGFNRFHHWYRCYETGAIYSPASVEEYIEYDCVMEVRGGHGNRILYTYQYIAKKG